MTDQTWLQSLKVGDEVAVRYDNEAFIHEIADETEAKWILKSGMEVFKP